MKPDVHEDQLCFRLQQPDLALINPFKFGISMLKQICPRALDPGAYLLLTYAFEPAPLAAITAAAVTTVPTAIASR